MYHLMRSLMKDFFLKELEKIKLRLKKSLLTINHYLQNKFHGSLNVVKGLRNIKIGITELIMAIFGTNCLKKSNSH